MVYLYIKMTNVAENIELVRQRISAAAERAGRSAQNVTLVAVTKTATAEQVEEAVKCGVKDFGENRVQAAESKIKEIRKSGYQDIRWHMIGHLQTNKVKKAVELFSLIHGVDSIRLAEEINKEAAKKDIIFPVLLEVNVAGEASKFGVQPQEAKELLKQCTSLPNIKVDGLMAMAPFSDDPEASRPHFKKMSLLKADLGLKYLSMGMSRDFEVAIEEGSDIIRVGTAIFG